MTGSPSLIFFELFFNCAKFIGLELLLICQLRQRNKKIHKFSILFAELDRIGGLGAHLNEPDLAGGTFYIVMEDECTVLGIVGIPEIVFHFRVPQFLEECASFCAHDGNAELAGEFWAYFYIMSFSIEVQVFFL